MRQLACAHRAQSTKAASAFVNHALVAAQRAANAARMARRLGGQIERGARIGVNQLHALVSSRKVVTQTIATDADRQRNDLRRAMAKQTCFRAGHVHGYQCTAKIFPSFALQSMGLILACRSKNLQDHFPTRRLPIGKRKPALRLARAD